MSSRSSSSVTCSRSLTSATGQPGLALRGLDQHPGESHQASEALGPDRRTPSGRSSGPTAAPAARSAPTSAGSKSAEWRSMSSSRRSATSSASSGGSRTVAFWRQCSDPGDHLAARGVLGLEDPALAGRAVAAAGIAELAVGAEVALHQPGDPVAEEDLRRALDLAQLPLGAAGVVAAVEVLGRREVVLGLGRVGDLAADPREAEDAHRVALVRVSDQIELPAAVDQVVGVHLPLLLGSPARSCSR